MKLVEGLKNDLRRTIEKELEDVSVGKKINVDIDLLDELIFFKGTDTLGNQIKVPVWTGDFLRKINLTKLSFDNVILTFDYLGLSIDKIMHIKDKSKFNKKVLRNGSITYKLPFVNGEIFNFSNTNINIDFSKIYGEAIDHCNFENVDLSNSRVDVLNTISDCNLKNTKIKLDLGDKNLLLVNNDLSCNDFSTNYIDSRYLAFQFIGNNFSDTKLNIIFNNYPFEIKKSIDTLEKLCSKSNLSETDLELKKELIKQVKPYSSSKYDYGDELMVELKSDHLVHCKINGKIVPATNENNDKYDTYMNIYNKLKKSVINSIREENNMEIFDI